VADTSQTDRSPIVGMEGVADVFSILHDGVIEQARSERSDLVLSVAIEYLARRVDPKMRTFTVRLRAVEALDFTTWPTDAAGVPVVIEDVASIFSPELDILSGEVADGRIHVACNQAEPGHGYCGGDLRFRAAAADVVDERGVGYSLERLAEIARGYWDEWSARHRPS
jgi:hypothetical protein